MVPDPTLRRQGWRRAVGPACALAALLVLTCTPADGQQGKKVDVLRIGSSGSFSGNKPEAMEKGALMSLQAFIKEETGLDNEIVRQKNWQELTDKLASGKLHLGVYQGYEFAWAQENHPGLKPLALAVNIHRYPTAHVVTNVSSKATDFSGLQGQSFALPTDTPDYATLFVDRQAQAAGKTLDTFFGKVTRPQNLEDTIDDVVDGIVNATVVDRAALEAFKTRKPARFKKLKEVAHSQPFPPPVVAYYDEVLDQATRERFRAGLLGANKKEKGKQTLELFGLTHFDPVPADFEKVVADVRKAYPPPKTK